MRALVQRVRRAQVQVAGEVVARVEHGLCVFVGIASSDGDAQAIWLSDKLLGLRIFEDPAGKMNLSVREVGGALLLVSQFTLYGDTRRGRRPSFTEAMRPEGAEPLFEQVVAAVRQSGLTVATGRFRTDMQVELVNDGPVTLWIDSALK
ncbi:MAG TPA: D-aminoacyl-tRNA deacylase [Polyangiaceae bacterium]|nr:D-aminoacyl-tRNA deacylase [Polyangiaceae bacterium]